MKDWGTGRKNKKQWILEIRMRKIVTKSIKKSNIKIVYIKVLKISKFQKSTIL